MAILCSAVRASPPGAPIAKCRCSRGRHDPVCKPGASEPYDVMGAAAGARRLPMPASITLTLSRLSSATFMAIRRPARKRSTTSA
jgi:hypothetical protein